MADFSTELLQAPVIIVMGILMIMASMRLVNVVSTRTSLPANVIYLIKAAIRWSVIVVVLSLLLALFGMSIKALWAALLSVAVLVAIAFFAGWSVLSNMLCSLLLLLFSRVRIGDIVELKETKHADAGVRGKIIDINLFFVTLEELEVDTAVSSALPTMQIPCHLFFFRVVRCWPGNNTQPLKAGFNPPNQDNALDQNETTHATK